MVMRLLGIVAFAAAAAWAQAGSIGFTPPSSKPEAIAGAPYSGEEEWDNGKEVIKGRFIYRDSEGRVRTERMIAPGARNRIVEIIDPVLGGVWILDTQHKVAHLMMPQPPPPPVPPSPSAQPLPPQPPPPPPPKMTIEPLEKKTIDGVPVTGTRSIAEYADGRKEMGEAWYSAELRIILVTKTSNQ